MEEFLNMLVKSLINWVNNFLWGNNILVVMLIGAALISTVASKFMQFRLFGTIISILTKKEKKKNGISSLETFFLGTACRVGAGNIAGVVAAITVGGPGALFWMWIVALFGAATSFIEATLAVLYRDKIGENNYIGGTPWILKNRLKLGKVGVAYAVASILCYVGVTQVMANSITESIASAYSIDQKIVAVILTLIVAGIIFGRGKKDTIINTLNKIVPIMAILYLGVVIFVLVTNFSKIPSMLMNIFQMAFGVKEIFGGGIGIVVMQGVRRGLFSNEAGSGNSNYAAAVVDIDEPAKQGMVQCLGVFVDTLVVCSATAFVISLSTILAVAYYGKNALTFISDKTIINILYQVSIILMVYTGGIQQNFFVWSLADFGLGIMTVINITFLSPLIGEALDELKKYEIVLKKEKNMHL